MGKLHTLQRFTNLLKSTDFKRIQREIPQIEDFRQEIRLKLNRYSDMETQLWFALTNAIDNSYGKHWGLYMDLVRMPSNEKQGIVYVHTTHSFKQSIDWVISNNGQPSERFKLNGTAKAYKRISDVREKNPEAQFNSVKEILRYQGFNRLQFLIMPQVIIDSKKDSLSLQNWFGDNSRFWTGQEVRNPYVDA